MAVPVEIFLCGLALSASIVAVGFGLLILLWTWAIVNGWARASRVGHDLKATP